VVGNTNKHDGVDAEDLPRASIEARLVVLEIIAMTSLALALDTSEDGSSDQARGLASLILGTVKERGREFGLSDQAQRSAEIYADELLSTALLSLYPEDGSA
jgi:hypothetical protein